MTIHTQVLEARLAQLMPAAQQLGATGAALRSELLRTLRQLDGLELQRADLDEAQAAAFDAELVRVYRRAARLSAAMPGEPAPDAAQTVLRIAALFGRSLDPLQVRAVAHEVATRPVMAPPVGSQGGTALVDAVFTVIALVAARAEPPAGAMA